MVDQHTSTARFRGEGEVARSCSEGNGAPDEMKLGTAMSLLCPLISQDDIDEGRSSAVS